MYVASASCCLKCDTDRFVAKIQHVLQMLCGGCHQMHQHETEAIPSLLALVAPRQPRTRS